MGVARPGAELRKYPRTSIISHPGSWLRS